MDTIRVRCRSCGKEVEAQSGKTATCGCPNMVTVSGDVISANDMSNVIMLSPRREERESRKMIETRRVALPPSHSLQGSTGKEGKS